MTPMKWKSWKESPNPRWIFHGTDERNLLLVTIECSRESDRDEIQKLLTEAPAEIERLREELASARRAAIREALEWVYSNPPTAHNEDSRIAIGRTLRGSYLSYSIGGVILSWNRDHPDCQIGDA